MTASLVVAGVGLQTADHCTLEVIETLKRADEIFYLLDDSSKVSWLQQYASTTQDLSRFYREETPRWNFYKEIADFVVSRLASEKLICIIFYGHPGVFNDIGHLTCRLAQEQNYQARMLPGLSSLDCLLSDLELFPPSQGYQSFEATDFLVHGKLFDPTVPLILWQIGNIGEPGYRLDQKVRRRCLTVLCRYLSQSYGDDHQVAVYQAATTPNTQPYLQTTSLKNLPRTEINYCSTLYIPPLETILSPSLCPEYKANLLLAGTGPIPELHLTQQVKELISSSSVIYTLNADPLLEAWLKATINDTATMVSPLPMVCPFDWSLYYDNISQGRQLILVRGNPAYNDEIPHIIKEAKQNNIEYRLLPALSREDVLFADQNLDPGKQGCLYFNTRSLTLKSSLKLEPTATLILAPTALPEKTRQPSDTTPVSNLLDPRNDNPMLIYDLQEKRLAECQTHALPTIPYQLYYSPPTAPPQADSTIIKQLQVARAEENLEYLLNSLPDDEQSAINNFLNHRLTDAASQKENSHPAQSDRQILKWMIISEYAEHKVMEEANKLNLPLTGNALLSYATNNPHSPLARYGNLKLYTHILLTASLPNSPQL